MRLRGGQIVARALKDAGARFCFGIPGTHNIELYDALEDSGVRTVLVTDEQSASFMADAVSRCGDSIGVANVVPGPGVTHCLSGVAEAWMDNVPLVVLTVGMRSDTGMGYQLHDIDQAALLAPVTKAVLKPASPRELYACVRRAFDLARSGAPGPVAVEIPAQFYLQTHELPDLAYSETAAADPTLEQASVVEAARLLNAGRRPLLYAGNGARQAQGLLVKLAERLSCPVTTTISAKGLFPESHPLWLANQLGAGAPPFARVLQEHADVTLAVGCRFGEVATGSYGLRPPRSLIHVDIAAEVLGRNFPATLAVQADAAEFLRRILPLVDARPRDKGLEETVAWGQKHARERSPRAGPGRVTPQLFFEALQSQAPDAVYATDSGNGTFLAMEHLRLERPGRFLAPVDYSSMGYSVPAAVAAKLARPEADVVALSGDGALLMTGLELLTASSQGAAVVVCVLRDGELGQIVQFQKTVFNRKSCGVLAPYAVEDFAKLTGCAFLKLSDDGAIGPVLGQAFAAAREGTPVVVEVAIDYSVKTHFTRGVVTTNFWRLTWAERLSMLLRAAGRLALKPR